MPRSVARHGWRKHGFTLIELLVVVAIIALLISILLPSLGRAREQSKTAVCASNLHQLGIATNYYLKENNDVTPYMRGTPNGDQNCVRPEGAPFRQYDTIFNFWRYLKDLKIYKCPSARDENSVDVVYRPLPGGQAYDPNGSYYHGILTDDVVNKARVEKWFPTINFDEYENQGFEFVPPLFVEYWFNDWGKCARVPDTINGGFRFIPAVSGETISKIPMPQLAVMMTDAVWELAKRDPEKLRHFGASQFVFLDGHVDKIAADRFYAKKIPGEAPKDTDQFGNRPFYTWGLSKQGKVDGDV